MREKIENLVRDIQDESIHGCNPVRDIIPEFVQALLDRFEVVEKDSKFTMTDLDLPPANRTLANLWMAECLKGQKELRNANKGLMRLNKKIKRLKKAGWLLVPLQAGEEVR